MKYQRFLVLVAFLILAVLAVSAASAQGETRAAPTNDNFANAKPIIIGKSYSEINIHEATVEIGQPATTSCGASSSIGNTVWYSFNLPTSADVHLSTGGSYFRGTSTDSYDTKIAVYTGATLGTLVQAVCNDDLDTLYGEVSFVASAATTYYILVGSFSTGTFLPGSVLNLRTRMLDYTYAPTNSGFETPVNGVDWKVTNSSGDGQICGDVTYPANAGNCAFRFVGNAGEASKLKLSEPLTPALAPRKDAIVRFNLMWRVQDAPLGSAKIKFKILYSDGTPTTIFVLNLTGQTAGGYTTVSRMLPLASKAVSKVQFQVVFKSTTGVLMLDAAGLRYLATPAVRSAPLPVPLAAK